MKAILYETGGRAGVLTNTIASSRDNGEENEVLNIYEDMEYQTWEGFGGALTDASGYVFSRLSAKQQNQILTMYFSPENMGYNQVRIHMDSCDFSTHMYEACPDEDDEELTGFSFADTQQFILPLLKAAEEKAGKKLKIMLSAWSPPAYMKSNGSRIKGGSLLRKYRERWARYICKYIQEFQNRGYQVERISIQNEPKAAQTWDSCQYTAQEEKEFLRDFLAPMMKVYDLEMIEIFIWDHNKERVYERAREIMDETTRELVAGVAFHWYSGDHFEALELVHQNFPDKKLILSESCLEFGKYEKDDQLVNAQRLAHDMIGNLNHGMVGFYDWNILLDSEGGPNHVQNFCDAPYLFDMEKKQLTERLCLWYYWHFAHAIKSGAVRLAHTRYTDKLDMTVWKNTDGVITFILLNKSDEGTCCHLRLGKEQMTFTIDARSIVSGRLDREEHKND